MDRYVRLHWLIQTFIEIVCIRGVCKVSTLNLEMFSRNLYSTYMSILIIMDVYLSIWEQVFIVPHKVVLIILCIYIYIWRGDVFVIIIIKFEVRKLCLKSYKNMYLIIVHNKMLEKLNILNSFIICIYSQLLFYY